MNGPIKKPEIGLGLGALEVWSIICGLIVVIGVLLESGPEFWQSASHMQIPSRMAIGGAMVAIGVFGEVAMGIFIARSARREHLESSERIATAAQATADANLKLALLQEKVSDRHVSQKQALELAQLLMPFGGRTLFVRVIEENEALRFSSELKPAFDRAGINVHQGPFDPAGSPSGMFIRSSIGDMDFASELSRGLSTTGITLADIPISTGFSTPGEVVLVISSKPM